VKKLEIIKIYFLTFSGPSGILMLVANSESFYIFKTDNEHHDHSVKVHGVSPLMKTEIKETLKINMIKYSMYPSFLDYYNQWLKESHIGWCEGHAPMLPSTNNANESSNATIKRFCTQFKRLSINNNRDTSVIIF
jgi:hypothetical protein